VLLFADTDAEANKAVAKSNCVFMREILFERLNK